MLKKNDTLTFLHGQPFKKSEKIFTVLGDLDELIVILGLVKAFSRKKKLNHQVSQLQDDLVQIGGFLAGVKADFSTIKKTQDLKATIKLRQDDKLQSFAQPGTNRVSAFLHLARTTTRRLERGVVKLKRKKDRPLVAWLNRRSTLLFLIAIKEAS